VTALVGLGVEGQLGPGQAVLVRGPDRGYFLLTASTRVPVSTDPRVFRALGIDAEQARPASAALLNAIPEQPSVAAPVVPSAGRRSPSYDLAGLPIGSVVRVERAASSDEYLLLSDGVQPVTPLMADLVRFTYAGSARIATVTPGDIGRVPTTRSPLPLPVLRSAPTVVAAAPVLCVSWRGRWAVSTPGRLPLGAPAASGVYVPPGHGAVVAAVGGSRNAATAARYLVTDAGVRFPVPDESALRMLGLSGTAGEVPSALIDLLPLGPTLDPARAKASWTSVPSPPGVSSSR
jgi:type VII secretion protein EccB